MARPVCVARRAIQGVAVARDARGFRARCLCQRSPTSRTRLSRRLEDPRNSLIGGRLVEQDGTTARALGVAAREEPWPAGP